MAPHDTALYDQDKIARPDVLPVNDHTRVYREEPLGWAYMCIDDRCTLNASGTKWHALSGYTTRGLALEAAADHVDAVRARREVIT